VSALPADGARIHGLDILRGIALGGMILVHFHQKMRLDAGGLEDLIGWFVYIFVEQKAWGTFACLFGIGFAVLLRRLDARGQAAAPIYLRRLAVLALFGVIAHVGFGFRILFSYGVWGVVLLLIRGWSTRALLVTATLAAMAEPTLAEIRMLFAWPPAPNGPAALAQAVEAAAAHGAYTDLLLARWRLFAATTPGDWASMLPDTNLALFIIGLLAVRHGIVDDPRGHEPTVTRWMIFGAASWAVSWLLHALTEWIEIPGMTWPLAMGLGLVRDQWLCFTYMGAVMLLLARCPRWEARLGPVGQAGRMALTNYMLQIVVLDWLASGYGLALKVRPLFYLPATLLLFGGEVILSGLWLSRLRYGLLEWLWRIATYARLEPIARTGDGQ
jgi:uncharacterized protein